MYFCYFIMKEKAGEKMDIRVLNYFLMVAREENITRASQLLHITQPTLSRQLMQLEEELGVKLFQRSNHSIYLTNDGLLFRRRAQEIVNLADKADVYKRQLCSLSMSAANGSTSLVANSLTIFLTNSCSFVS